MIDLIIIGGGPAGLSAALYAARANLRTLIFEGSMEEGLYPGGQLTTTSLIENYIGLDKADGREMMENFRNHAEKYGAMVLEKTVTCVEKNLAGNFVVYAAGTVETWETKSLIVATGATAKKLGIPGEEKYYGKGITGCAVCDGSLPVFRDKPIAVVGAGDSACEAALYMSRFACKVYLLCRSNKMRASTIMRQRVENCPKISILYNTTIKEALGDEFLKALSVTSVVNDKEENYMLYVFGLFYAIGHSPATAFFKNTDIALDAEGYVVVTDQVFTSVKGVYAAGDCSDRKYRQAIISAGMGAIAALEVEKYISTTSLEEK